LALGQWNEHQEAAGQLEKGDSYFFKGKYSDASVSYSKVVELKPNWPIAYWSLAISYLRTGELEKALEQMKRCQEFGPPVPGSPDDVSRTLQELIELDPKLPALSEGKEKPGTVDRSELAQLCVIRQFPRAAVRFYTEFLASNPQVTDQDNGYRYNAACAAALAAAGRGKDTAKLDKKELSSLRKQVFDWLNAELVVWAKRAESEKPEDRVRVQQVLQHWKTDKDLAGIRDKDAVAKLPAGEQQACKKLCAEVEALLKKTQAVPTKK
jgi:tetratricopeptide (TPR) repeat protein